jgi:outer membrane protein assembly factor BamB
MKNSPRLGACAAVLAALSFAFCSQPTLARDEATAFQNNAAHDGSAHFKERFKTPLKRKWQRDLVNSVSYPLIAKGMVFVTVSNGGGYGTQLYALSLKTGETIWQQPIDGTYFWSNATYDKGQVFVVNVDGLVRSFSADTGTPGWSYQIPEAYLVSSAPTASGGKVFVSIGTNYSVYGIDELTGSQLWQQAASGDISPAVGGHGVYLTYPGNYYGYSTKGKSKWQTSGSGNYGGSGAYYKGQVFSRDGAVLDAASGNTVATLPATSSAAALWRDNSGNTFRLAQLNGTLSSVNVQTGTEAWNFGGDGALGSAPLVVNDSVIIGSASGTLFVLDAATGSEQWSDDIGAPIQASEGDYTQPWTGLGAAEDTLVVPASNLLVAYVSKTTH